MTSPDLAEIFRLLRPTFQAMVHQQIAATLSQRRLSGRLRPATVVSTDLTSGTASILVDGDSTPIAAQLIGVLPSPDDRVMVRFEPPHGVFVVGHVGGSPFVFDYSEAGFLVLAAAVATAAGPFELPQPAGPVFAFMVSEWTTYCQSGSGFSGATNEVSFDGGSNWNAPASANLQAMQNETGENYAVTATIHGAAGTPTGSVQFRTRASKLGSGNIDFRWPHHLYGYVPYVDPVIP